MQLKEIMQQLKDVGTDQNIKIYKRHGAKEPLFGVSFADLKKFAKSLRKQPELAIPLWDTKNCDARILATMIADPNQLTAAVADRWVKEVDYTTLAGYLGAHVAKSPLRDSRMDKWMTSRAEFIKDTGFSILNARLKNGDEIPAARLEEILNYIEKKHPSSS